MKVYVVTSDDIEDHSPEAVFSTGELAMNYLVNKNGGNKLTQHKYYGKGNYEETYSVIEEFEIDTEVERSE